MHSEDQRQLDEETCRAIGRFVVSFSGLLFSLETSTVQMLHPEPDFTRRLRIEAALADRTASPIVSAYFSVFYHFWGEALTESDARIMKCLRRELDEVVQTRNRMMHDAWLSVSVGGDPGPHNMTLHRVRAHGRGVEYESRAFSPSDIHNLSLTVDRLASVVNAAVWYFRPGQQGPELERRLSIVNDRVQRL